MNELVVLSIYFIIERIPINNNILLYYYLL